MFLRILFLLILGFQTSSAWAADSILFKNGREVPNYTQIVAGLKSEDTVILNGRAFQVHGILGQGLTTKILDIGDGLALRIPLRQGKLRGVDYKEFIEAFSQGYQAMKDLGVRVVKLHDELSESPYFLVVEKVDTKFDLQEFARGRVQIGEEERKLAQHKLLEFARKTAHLRMLGDFHEGQLRWTGQEWVLMDFTDGVEPIRAQFDTTLFSLPDLPQDFRKWLVNAVFDFRGLRRATPTCHRVHQ